MPFVHSRPGLIHAGDDLAAGAHAEAVRRGSALARSTRERVIGGRQEALRHLLAVAPRVDQLLPVLDAHAELKGLGLERDAIALERVPGIARAVARGEQHGVAAELAAAGRERADPARRAGVGDQRLESRVGTRSSRRALPCARAAAAGSCAGDRCRRARARRRAPRAERRRRRAPRAAAPRAGARRACRACRPSRCPAPPSPNSRLASGSGTRRLPKAATARPRSRSPGPRSSSVTRAPLRASTSAANRPAGPAPTTATCAPRALASTAATSIAPRDGAGTTRPARIARASAAGGGPAASTRSACTTKRSGRAPPRRRASSALRAIRKPRSCSAPTPGCGERALAQQRLGLFETELETEHAVGLRRLAHARACLTRRPPRRR